MKHPILFPVLAISLFAPQSPAPPQTPSAIPPTSATVPQPLTRNRADEQVLLARARHGDRSAQFWLGAGYEQGSFGQPDYHDALKWLRRAAKHDDPDAQVNLGQMYADGEGVTQNYVQAAKWYRKAAEHVPNLGGAGQGRNNLGLLYLDGLGVPKDHVRAYMWFSLGNSESNLSCAKAQMTPAQITEAERMAAEWISRHAAK